MTDTHPLPVQRIAILSPAHPLRGGIAASTERLASALQERGHTIKIYSFKLQYPNFLFPGKTQFTADPAPANLEITSAINSINPFNWISVARQIRQWQPDLILVRFWLPFMGPALGSILRLAKTPAIALVDNLIPHESRPGDAWFTSYFLGAIDGFLAMSKSVQKDIEAHTHNKPVLYSPHPLYDDYGPIVSKEEACTFLDLDPAENHILFFGFIRDYKGLDLLFEALAQPPLKDFPVKLIVAGEYYGKQEKYEQLIDQLNLRDRLVLHTRFIPNDHIKYYFGAADLVVQPYRTATQSGISQIAYHFEKPMVVTNVGGLPEIVPHDMAGYVADVDPVSIAKMVHRFFVEDKAALFTEGIQSRKNIYSWEKMTATFESLVEQIS